MPDGLNNRRAIPNTSPAYMTGPGITSEARAESFAREGRRRYRSFHWEGPRRGRPLIWQSTIGQHRALATDGFGVGYPRGSSSETRSLRVFSSV